MRRGDFWSGLALAALGAWIVTQARAWSYMGEDGPGAGFFPLWYGAAMVVLSLALVLMAVTGRATGAPRPVSRADLGRAFACWAAFVAAVALMRVVGFVPAFAALTWFMVAVLARRPQRSAIVLAVAGSAGFWLVFELGLDVALPRGLLF
jgi:putative tricarboxylic transport membrane protein